MRIFSILQASAMVLAVGMFPAARADVFINELHYDNTGADVGEAVEVVATGGENLNLYSIVLYNGATGQSYDTDPVPAGALANCAAGGSAVFSTVIPGQIQNGNPDGLALIGPSGVVQFLSYGGAFVALNGPANGLMSQDIGVTEAAGSAIGLSLQLTGGPGATYASFAWAGSSDDNFGACNTGQSFGAPVDNPPTVTSTSPVAGSNTALVNTDIVINFSEPVAVVDPWLSLECNAVAYTGPITSSNGGATWTLNPDNNLVSGESCDVSITNANVTDLDGGSNDALTGTNDFGFTVAPDNAPTVLSSIPADNAINVVASSNISITFSEPVAFIPTAATTLSCNLSGPHPFALSGGPTAYTLNPNTDFGEEDCTLTIAAADVVDQDGDPTPMAADFVLNFSTIESLAGNYYDGVDTTSCTTLRNSLHELIDDHIAFPYTSASTDTWDILNAADQNPLNPAEVLEVYENNHHVKIAGGVGPYNREHTWPNSYGFNNLSNAPGDIPQSAAYTDTHMLYLSDVEYNSTRGNKPYADCPQASGCSEYTTLAYNGQGGGPVIYPGNHNWSDATNGNQGSFEVWNFRKGDVARAVMYMDIRYEGGVATGGNTIGQSEPDLILTDNRNLLVPSTGPTGYMGLLSTLLAWHAADPPDAQEQLRNDVIFSYQQNRNPFIDHPEWACVLANPCTCALAPPAPEPLIFLNGFE